MGHREFIKKGRKNMAYNTIIYEQDEAIAYVTLNRPKSMNSLNSELIGELNSAIDAIVANNEISVVIIKGGEKFFAAGADIKEIDNISSPVEAHNFVSRVQSVINRIELIPKPVIAAVSGYALGGGCELALACDIRIAAENAMFGLPEIKLGVIPGGGGTQRLPRLIGTGRAKELLFTGDPINAQEAYRIGLANKVVPLESLLDEANKMASVLLERPGVALMMNKIAVNDGMNMDMRSALAYEVRCFATLFSTEDQKEGIQAFIEKRKPNFKGI
jgi:enoyl-CoA hydratase